MLFERVRDEFADDGEDEEEWEGGSLDPSSLLNVVGALAKLTRRLADRPGLGSGVDMSQEHRVGSQEPD